MSGSTALPPNTFFRPAIIEERHANWWRHHVEPVEHRLNPLARRVLLALLDHVCNSVGTCWPGPTRLAQICNCNSGSVYRSLNELSDLGVVVIDTNPDQEMYPGVRRLYRIVGYQETWIGQRPTTYEWSNVAAADIRATRTLNSELQTHTLNKSLSPAVPAWAMVAAPKQPPARPAKETSVGDREAARLAAREVAMIEDMCRPSANGVRLRPRQATDLLAYARSIVNEEKLFDVVRKLSFIHHTQTIEKSAFHWWEKALREHPDYRRGPDEAAVAKQRHREAAATRQRAEMPLLDADDPPPTRGELHDLWAYYKEVGDMQRCLAVQAVINKQQPVTAGLKTMIRRLRSEELEAPSSKETRLR